MLLRLKELNGRAVEGREGEIGAIQSSCFDGQDWTVRYFLLATGGRLRRKETAIATAALPDQDFSRATLCSELTLARMQNAPDIDIHSPVSLLEERAAAEYYGWPRYWETMATPHGNYADRSGGVTCALAERHGPPLYDVRSFAGYRVIASDGEAGVIEDGIVDSHTWRVRYFIIDFMAIPGRKLLIAARWIINVNTFRSEVHINIAQGLLANGPEYDPSVPLDQRFEQEFCSYYGLPENWC